MSKEGHLMISATQHTDRATSSTAPDLLCFLSGNDLCSDCKPALLIYERLFKGHAARDQVIR